MCTMQVSGCRTRGESEDHTGEKVCKESTLVLKPRVYVTRSPKQAPREVLMSSNNFKEKGWVKNFCKIDESVLLGNRLHCSNFIESKPNFFVTFQFFFGRRPWVMQAPSFRTLR